MDFVKPPTKLGLVGERIAGEDVLTSSFISKILSPKFIQILG